METRKLYYLAIISLFFSCNSAGQNKSYKDLPHTYAKMVTVTNKERDSIKKTLSDLYYLEKMLPKNYVKNGTVDYTKEVQEVLKKYKNVVFPSFPILINKNGLSVGSNSTLFFEKGSKLILIPNELAQYEILRIHDVKNVKIFFANIKGERYTHTANDGEWGMGISIRGTDNILIYAPTVTECWGDGIFLGMSPVTHSMINNNVIITKALLDNNRRNGMSIISAQNVKANKFVVSNTDGTPPTAGIDIEPDVNTNIIKNLYFNDIISFNNKTHGFLFVLGNLYGKNNDIGTISVNNFKAIYGELGISFRVGSEKGMDLIKPTGNIEVKNAKFENVSRQEYLSYDENIRNNFQIKIQTKDDKDVNKYNYFFNNAKKIIVIR